MAYFSSHGCLLQPLLMVTTATVVATPPPQTIPSVIRTNIYIILDNNHRHPTVTAATISINRVATTTVVVTSKFSSANPMVLSRIPIPLFTVPYHFMSRHRRGGKHQLSPRDPMASPSEDPSPHTLLHPPTLFSWILSPTFPVPPCLYRWIILPFYYPPINPKIPSLYYYTNITSFV
ncbi:hypothetical protein VIGAN_02119800 [Vigna angularis var. angularis]|uniref:Uncharacterized protein n=1 Tax=Vigna angularis var. angularis TaxID=157739 RepID=A0A0S3RD96_PHAAN|nr:hypothetical protein VIGAN_02119800 [Vigna angularis var. angularis]